MTALETFHPLFTEKAIFNLMASLMTHVAALVVVIVTVTCLKERDQMENDPFRSRAAREKKCHVKYNFKQSCMFLIVFLFSY